VAPRGRRFSRAGLIVGVLTPLLVVGAAAVTRGGIFSPGPLRDLATVQTAPGQSTHADLVCDDCHTPFWSPATMADRCLACHKDVKQELAQPDSLHGRLPAYEACRGCHTEHGGPKASLTRVDFDNFPHYAFGYSLDAHTHRDNGSHFTCEDCHTQGLRRFDVKECSRCHLNIEGVAFMPHEVTFGSACLNCHNGPESFSSNFDHGTTGFPLVAAHASLACGDCHAVARTLEDLKAAPIRCVGCHAKDDAHSGRLGDDCAACHKPVRWSEVNFNHADVGFVITGKHTDLTCSACHVKGNTSQVPSSCVGCHGQDDSHQGRLGNDCSACHDTLGWTSVQFDHAVTGFALTQAHGGLACNTCHSPSNVSPAPSDCVGCHLQDDAHDGAFGADCSACHRPTLWSDWTFNHNLSPFKLTGAHIKTTCVSCHVGGRFQDTATACVACHAEPAFHAGLFGTNCASCHSTSAWRPAAFNGPHSFPLNHGDAGGNCATCHPSSYTSYTCYKCHNQGRIERKHSEEGIRNLSNCVACHRGGRGGDD